MLSHTAYSVWILELTLFFDSSLCITPYVKMTIEAITNDYLGTSMKFQVRPIHKIIHVYIKNSNLFLLCYIVVILQKPFFNPRQHLLQTNR
jgi:hypothetical protein